MSGKKSKRAEPEVRDAHVKKIKDAFAANDAAHREGYDADTRKTAAVVQRLMANASEAEQAASVRD